MEYDNAVRKSILLEKGARRRSQGAHREQSDAIDQNIGSLRAYVDRLEVIHQHYLLQVNDCGYESSEMAAYLLLSRVISTLKMCCMCATNRYWYWGSLLREIDEALDVALYFVISSKTEAGKKAIRDWFRLNEAPRHSKCREQISKHQASLNLGYTESNHMELMAELYNKKSKFTHPTYRVIREVTEFEIFSGEVRLNNIDYGPCASEHSILELVDFFQTSILIACQSFLRCFWELPLLEEHWSELRQIERDLLMSSAGEYGNSGVVQSRVAIHATVMRAKLVGI